MSHRANANYESPDAIELSLRGSRRDYGVSCSTRLHLRRARRRSASVPRLLVLEPAYSWRLLAIREERQNRPEKAQRDQNGRLGRALFSSRLSLSRLPLLHRVSLSFARASERMSAHVEAAGVRGSFSLSAKLNKTICSKANNGIRFTCE